MFVDASAIVAILTRAPDADALADALQRDSKPITSALAVFEATLAIRRKRRGSVEETHADVRDFLQTAGIGQVPIAGDDDAMALAAFARFGKGSGHKAQLNMGDCFAYTSARRHGATLLFKGNDFSLTDIAPALPRQ